MMTSPFVGLRPYFEEDRPYFFGRSREQLVVAANLLAWRITVLTGASGVGKTSLLRAGVIPLLMSPESPFGTLDGAVVYVNQWQQDPLRSIMEAISATVPGADNAEIPEPLDTHALKQALAAKAKLAGGDLLIVLDQFEEFFLFHGDDDALVSAVTGPMVDDALPISFLIAIREDHLAELGAFRRGLANILANTIYLVALSPAGAVEIVKGAVDSYNQRTSDPVRVEPQLVERIVTDLGWQRTAVGSRVQQTGRLGLPLLQLVMERLWNREQALGSRDLRLETLDSTGGATAMLRSYFNSTLDTLPNTSRRILSAIIPFLVTPSGAKVAQTTEGLAAIAGIPEKQVREVLDTMVTARLLHEVAGPSGEWYVELEHDLIGPALLEWRAHAGIGSVSSSRTKRDRTVIVMMIVTLASLVLAVWALWKK